MLKFQGCFIINYPTPKHKKMYTPLELGKVYYVKVTNIHANRKSFQKKDIGTLHVHDIFAQDSDGTKYKCEYLTKTETQDAFTTGVYQYFKCVKKEDYTDLIEPYDPAFQQSQVTERTTDVDKILLDANRNLPLSETAAAIALRCATQVISTRITSDIEFKFDSGQLFELAEEMANWLLSKRDL